MLNLLPPGHPHARRRTRGLQRAWWWWTLMGIGTMAGLYVIAATAVFFAVRWHLTDTGGEIDPRAGSFNQLANQLATEVPHLPSVVSKEEAAATELKRQNDCQLALVRAIYPRNAEPIAAAEKNVGPEVVAKMMFAIRLRLPSGSALLTAMTNCTDSASSAAVFSNSARTENIFPWANTNEWSIVKAAFAKDKKVIERASQASDVDPRLIVSVAMVEQLRLYFTERELFEKFFQPLKILGNATQFAWGVMAIKEKTAIDVENHLRDPRSPYYLGVNRAKLLALPADNPSKARFERLTNEHDHYYSYLYGSLELAQYMAQWERAGFPIDDRPEILATLFNIGFGRSRPSASPQVGGSTIKIAKADYTFGALAFEWYYSGEMQDLFPYPIVTKP